MNTNGMHIDALAKIQEKARGELYAMPWWQRQQFYLEAEARYSPNWRFFTSEGKDACALLEYIRSLPEPGATVTVNAHHER